MEIKNANWKKKRLFFIPILIIFIIGFSSIQEANATITNHLVDGHNPPTISATQGTGILFGGIVSGLTANATITKIGLNVSIASGSVKLAIYTSSAAGCGIDQPNTLLYTVPSTVLAGPGMQNFSTNVIVPANGKLWVVEQSNTGVAQFYFFHNNTPGTKLGVAQNTVYANPFPQPFMCNSNYYPAGDAYDDVPYMQLTQNTNPVGPGGFNPYVTTLGYNILTNTTVGLTWQTPNFAGFPFYGYNINYTTPYGKPQTVIVANTGSPSTSYTVSNLTPNTPYSFRIGSLSNGTNYVSQANILNVTTLYSTSPNLTPGNLNLNVGVNPNVAPFQWYRQDVNSTALHLFVGFPNSFNTTCNFNYQFEHKNQTFYNLSTTANGTGRVKANFFFTGVGNEVINSICKDVNTNATSHYVITNAINSIPLIQQIHDFQAGKFGTAGQFGAFDLIELIVLLLSMLGLNRLDQTVGVIIMIIVLGALAFFHIGDPIVLIISAIAMIALIAVGSNRKLAFSP